jgi:hypothetical protein
MALFNTKIEFVGSGKIKANVDTVLFEDTYLTDTLAVAEAGHADLDVRFVNDSILGALNELMNGLVDTSGLVTSSVICYSEAVDTAEFVHTLTHNLDTLNLMVQMYDADPASGPVATNTFTCFTPVDSNSVRVELDAATSGFFVVFGCPSA